MTKAVFAAVSSGPRLSSVGLAESARLASGTGVGSTMDLPLPAHRWYDWRVTRGDDDAFVRRFAGHVENGQPSITDPAMHGPALLDHDAPRPAAIVKA